MALFDSKSYWTQRSGPLYNLWNSIAEEGMLSLKYDDSMSFTRDGRILYFATPLEALWSCIFKAFNTIRQDKMQRRMVGV